MASIGQIVLNLYPVLFADVFFRGINFIWVSPEVPCAVSSFAINRRTLSVDKRSAIIITAFNNGDKKTLKDLVSPDVYNAFDKAINDNQNNPASQFYSLVIDSIEDAKVENGKISISINFISEQMLNNDEGSIVKNKDTWTFEKPVKSTSPKWTLTQT